MLEQFMAGHVVSDVATALWAVQVMAQRSTHFDGSQSRGYNSKLMPFPTAQ
jgi:hypothetical protein